MLLTNNSVYYYLHSGYDLKELEKLKLEVKSYNPIALKYPLPFGERARVRGKYDPDYRRHL